MKHWTVCCALILIITGGCRLLPSNFESLPLSEKVDAYAEYFKYHNVPSVFARSRISWHGWAAADIMAQYLAGQRQGLPDIEAVEIIHAVQLRGCSLRGTSAERALEGYLSRQSKDTYDYISAKDVLGSIMSGIKYKKIRYDDLKGGPCEAGAPASH